MSYYAVAKGWGIGIYPTWEKCHWKVNCYSGAVYKRFNNWFNAWNFLERRVPHDILERVKRKETLFTRTNSGYIEIYTDGACRKNGKHGAEASIGIFFDNNHPENVSKIVNRRTSIGAEIQAVVEAVMIIDLYQLDDVIIYTDCQFIVKGLNYWARGWTRNGWKNSNNQPVAYRREFQFLTRKKHRWSIRFEHVRGHCGIYGNVQADKLARNALQ